MSNTWESLSAVLRSAPDLRGARCAGRWDLFDAEQDDPEDRAWAVERAIQICGDCPVLGPCTAYVDGLKPSRRPPGVVAGRLVQAPKPTRRAA
jgi:hypothetical protein